MFIAKSELDTCLFQYVRIIKKLKKSRTLARKDYYYIDLLEYITKMPLIEQKIPSAFALKLYDKIRKTSDKVSAFVKYMKNKGIILESRFIRGKEYFKIS